jgi:hypothetical protein
VSNAEFLEVGDDAGPRVSRPVRRSLVAGAVVLAVVSLVIDRELREREELAVAKCVSDANAAVSIAGREVRATYEYVRPLLMDPTPELQDALRRMVEKAAVGADAPLAAPRQRCTTVPVFPLHDELQARRDRCVEVLRAHESGLAAVAEDGGELGEWLGTPLTC